MMQYEGNELYFGSFCYLGFFSHTEMSNEPTTSKKKTITFENSSFNFRVEVAPSGNVFQVCRALYLKSLNPQLSSGALIVQLYSSAKLFMSQEAYYTPNRLRQVIR